MGSEWMEERGGWAWQGKPGRPSGEPWALGARRRLGAGGGPAGVTGAGQGQAPVLFVESPWSLLPGAGTAVFPKGTSLLRRPFVCLREPHAALTPSAVLFLLVSLLRPPVPRRRVPRRRVPAVRVPGRRVPAACVPAVRAERAGRCVVPRAAQCVRPWVSSYTFSFPFRFLLFFWGGAGVYPWNLSCSFTALRGFTWFMA